MLEQDQRPWVKVSVDYFDNPKIDALSDLAQLLHLVLIVKSGQQKTDGIVSPRLATSRGQKPFKELLKAGLIRERHDGQYVIHDYEKHQTPKVKMRRGNPAKGAHTVHHVKRGIYVPECEFCAETEPAEVVEPPLQSAGPIPF